ncbi:lysine exporter LysO family protein [Neisseriaceae bacterium ESL0693]|nr:lysine exporter LysO family protein [Neisseriaceae bacterium ESL0693]
MQNVQTLVMILLPLFIGFMIPVSAGILTWINRGLSWLVYLILLLIGLSLSQVHNLGNQLGMIALSAVVLFVCVMGMNLLCLVAFDHYFPVSAAGHQTTQSHAAVSIGGSLKQVACVLLGLAIGLLWPDKMVLPHDAINVAVMVLILLVGIQLRGSGISLHRVLLNQRGVLTAVIFMLACMAGGLLFALIMPSVSWSQGLALSSGYGWYSLSGIVMSHAYGPVIGSVAILNDLAREFFALLFIPFIMRRYPSAAVSSGGATSLDFTLPVIQASGGLAVMPLAISFGFITNIMSPVLMVFFSSLSH